MPSKIKLTQPPEEIPAEIIATAIIQIADAMKALNNSRLKRDAIVTLIQHKSKVARRTIEDVLDNLENLKKDWIRP